MNVKLYWNLHKKCWSVQHKGRVILHTPTYLLAACRFVVQEGARQRVLKDKSRSVHAYVTGTATEDEKPSASADLVRVRYNPYRANHFHTEDNKPVHAAAFVFFNETGEAWAQLEKK